MKLLLDTHIFLWWILEDPRLPLAASEVIADSDNELYLSSASTWEMVIKSAIGKLSLPASPATFIKDQLILNEITPLPITIEHTFALASLPMLHKDPFDRMLIAQTNYENLTLVTDDPTIKKYHVNVL
jgi:PIN domain nuclease of toxin-antitoxin system